MAVPSGNNTPAVSPANDAAGAHVAPGGTPGVEDTAQGGLNDVGAPGVMGAEENILSFVEQMENDSADEVSTVQPEVVEERSAGATPAVEPVAAPVAPQKAQPAVEPAPAPVAPVAPAAPAAVTPGAAAPQPGQPPTEGQAAPGAEPGQPVAPAAELGDGPVDPFALAAQTIQQYEAKFVEKLAADVYQIDQAQFEQVLGGDAKTLSLLCARVHANAVSSCMRTVAATLPVYMDGLLQVRDRNREREDRFWSANTHLDRTKHKAHLKPIIAAAKQLHPQADEATMDRLVGQMAAASFGISLGQAPAQPSAPRVVTPGPVVRQVNPAYQPAAVNGAAPGQPNGGMAPEENVFTRMTGILQADDQGLFD